MRNKILLNDAKQMGTTGLLQAVREKKCSPYIVAAILEGRFGKRSRDIIERVLTKELQYKFKL